MYRLSYPDGAHDAEAAPRRFTFLRDLGTDERVPMLLAALGYWVLGVPFGALLAFGLGLGGVGVWLGMATGLTIVAGLLTRRWVKLSRLQSA